MNKCFFRFDVDELTKFTLTVRRNYRRVPYHNWTHAFSVAHCMFMILRQASSNFMLTEVGEYEYISPSMKIRNDYYILLLLKVELHYPSFSYDSRMMPCLEMKFPF
jgi:hypothetical protein